MVWMMRGFLILELEERVRQGIMATPKQIEKFQQESIFVSGVANPFPSLIKHTPQFTIIFGTI
jgi:hypothetical protein